MSTPIERIAGYACQVNEDKWRELVKVAYRVESSAGDWASTSGKFKVNNRFAWITDRYNKPRLVHRGHAANFTLIPYLDFLAKLKGEEKWEPKNGEEVEVSVGRPSKWVKAEFVCIHKTYYICSLKDEWQYLPFTLNLIRPLRPTITRTEAEQTLGKRIVD